MLSANSSNSPRAFTLVELLVVIGIIAVLISILMPALVKARIAAVQTQCMSNHRQLLLGIAMYVSDYDSWSPREEVTYPSPNTDRHRWFKEPMIGKYIGNRQDQHDKPNTTDVIYCAAFPKTVNQDNIGIGLNIRRNSFISRDNDSNNKRKKYTSIKRTSETIILVDIISGFRWEKYFYGDTGSTITGSGSSGMVAYRHGKSTVIGFADGHVETFQSSDAPTGIVHQNTGLHAAFQAKQVKHTYN